MSLNRNDEILQLAMEVTKTITHPELKWEPKLREGSELVSEFIEEKIGREILSNIDKFKDTFDVVRSRTDTTKHRMMVNLRLLHQLKQLQMIVDYLNENHAPPNHKTWEVARVVTGNTVSYPLRFTNFPQWLGNGEQYHAINQQFYQWNDYPKIEAKFKEIKPEYQKRCVVYTVSDGELLKELSLLAGKTKTLQPPKP